MITSRKHGKIWKQIQVGNTMLTKVAKRNPHFSSQYLESATKVSSAQNNNMPTINHCCVCLLFTKLVSLKWNLNKLLLDVFTDFGSQWKSWRGLHQLFCWWWGLHGKGGCDLFGVKIFNNILSGKTALKSSACVLASLPSCKENNPVCMLATELSAFSQVTELVPVTSTFLRKQQNMNK